MYLLSAALAKNIGDMKNKLIKMETNAAGGNASSATIDKKVRFTIPEKAVFAVSLVIYLLLVVLIVKNLNNEDHFFLFGVIFNSLWLGLFMFFVVWMIIAMMHGYHYIALQEKEKQAAYLKFDLPVWSLLVSNVVVIIWAVAEKWSLYMILWVYWGQSICIGFFLLLQALLSAGTEFVKSYGGTFGKQNKVLKTLGFLFVYILFHCGYVVFLKGFFKDLKLEPNLHFIILCAVGIFFVQQVIAFIYDFIKGTGGADIDSLIAIAGLRIIPMHLTIMGAGFLSQAAGLSIESSVMLILFLGLKSFADIGMCLHIRKGFSQKMDAIFEQQQ
jgi:hypothetical protein